MNPQDPVQPFRDEYRAIEKALAAARNQSEALELKRSIIELYHKLDDLERRFGDVRLDLKKLVDRYRALPADSPRPATGVEPVDLETKPDRLGSATYVDKAWNCIALEDYEGAITLLNRALELAPGDTRALSFLGWALMMMEDYDEALRTYQLVLVANPGDALARVNLGYICLKKGIFGEAIEHLSKAVRTGGDRKANLYGHYYLGLVYLARQMYGDAESFFEKAIELGPAMSEAYYQLGRARYTSGRTQAAIEAWRSGAASNRYGPWGRRCAAAVEAAESGREPVGD